MKVCAHCASTHVPCSLPAVHKFNILRLRESILALVVLFIVYAPDLLVANRRSTFFETKSSAKKNKQMHYAAVH